MQILDSGTRRNFESGAVRDIAEGKGRCDLLPLHVISHLYEDKQAKIFRYIYRYIRDGREDNLLQVIWLFTDLRYGDTETTLLEVAKQYEEGAKKYDERNWEKGIPLHCYIDSGIRHYIKFLRGDTDEPHDRAFIWNMLGALWTQSNKPELIDLPFAKSSDSKEGDN